MARAVIREDCSPGAAVALRREQLGLSREALAVRAGVAWHTVRDMEAGRRRPRPASLALIAAALGLDAAALAAPPARAACAPGLGWPIEAPPPAVSRG